MISTTGIFSCVCVALALLLAGCAANTTYRTDLQNTCSIGDRECLSSLELNGERLENSSVALAFVEVNDQGLLRERGQLDRAKELIRARGRNGNQAVMLFVHGWHNNARPDNGNVKTIRRLLERYSQLFPNVAVTGVYVGWRGDSWLLPSIISFWDRKQVSIEVGQGALVDIISAVESASIETKSRMVSIGHSFGGSALFNATRSLLLSRLDSPPKALEHEQFPMHAAVGDLILIVNPAFEAMQYWPLHSATRDRIKKNDPVLNRGPRMVILQGQKDWPTRYGFPAGRSFTVPFEAHVDDSDSMDGSYRVPEWRLDLFSIGHFRELNTHDLFASNNTHIDYTRCGHNVDADAFKSGQWLSPNAHVQLKPRPSFVAGDPFWVVLDKELSGGHNDLEDGRLTCMIADLLSTYTQFEPGLYR